jgi:glutathione synthase/RimK-type ligase-like ATP-grasp enzyme
MKINKHRYYWMIRNFIKKILFSGYNKISIYDDSDRLNVVDQVLINWPEQKEKPLVGLVIDPHPKYPYWTKFRKFLIANQIPYEIYDIHKSNWLTVGKKYDIIIWRPFSMPSSIDESKKKIYLIEKHLNKTIYPSFEMIMLYEDKIMQYELMKFRGLPVVETFISNNYDEINDALPKLKYPLIAKINMGSGSLGTELISSIKQARELTQKVFSYAGRMTYWPYLRQKDYVYFQKYIDGAKYDLRIIIVGDVAGGYYRDVPRGEFRASGMHTERHGPISEEALWIAKEVADKLGFLSIAVDMVFCKEDNNFKIIEISSFIEVQSEMEVPAKVDGISGIYRLNTQSHKITFEPKNFWLQEFILYEFFNKNWLSR